MTPILLPMLNLLPARSCRSSALVLSMPSRPAGRRLRGLLVLLLATAGCGDTPDAGTAPSRDASPPTPTAPAERVSAADDAMTVAELRERLGIGQAGQIRKVGGEIVAMDLRQTPIVDLTPLQGLPLRQLFVEETRVADLSPLRGMPLEQLYLSHTPVTDLSPLVGASLQELNLTGTAVVDLTPLKEVEIGTLWLPQTKVTDLSPLAGRPLVSLDLQDTPVSDLSPLSTNQSLRRLHIGGTAVTDLSPLRGLQLERLVLSPERITAGIDAIREMGSLRGLDVSFDGQSPVMTPADFWTRYDAGEWATTSAKPAE